MATAAPTGASIIEAVETILKGVGSVADLDAAVQGYKIGTSEWELAEASLALAKAVNGLLELLTKLPTVGGGLQVLDLANAARKITEDTAERGYISTATRETTAAALFSTAGLLFAGSATLLAAPLLVPAGILLTAAGVVCGIVATAQGVQDKALEGSVVSLTTNAIDNMRQFGEFKWIGEDQRVTDQVKAQQPLLFPMIEMLHMLAPGLRARDALVVVDSSETAAEYREPIATLNVIRRLVTNEPPLTTMTGSAYLQALTETFSAVQSSGNLGKYSFQAWPADRILLYNMAKNSADVRAAMVIGAPFYISGPMARPLQAEATTLFDPATGQGTLTEEWLRDRAYFLAGLTKARVDDLPLGADGAFHSQGTTQDSFNVRYEDESSGAKVTVFSNLSTPSTLPTRKVIFGSEEVDSLLGQDENDRMYGGSGADILQGMGGDDYIEGQAGADEIYGGAGDDTLLGGIGADKYYFTGAFGKDVLFDSDGNGTIRIDGSDLTDASTTGRRNTWVGKLADGRSVELALKEDPSLPGGYTLVVTAEGSAGNSITIKNFNLARAQSGDGYLGIKLESANKIALLAGPQNFWEDPNADLSKLAGLRETIMEKGGSSFAVSLSRAANAGDTVTISLAGLGGQGLQVVANGQTYTGDVVTLALAEGQTQLGFALIQDGQLTGEVSGSIKATYNGNAGSSESNEWSLILQAASNAGNAFEGDFTKKLKSKQNPDEADRYELDALGNYVVDSGNPVAAGAADLFHGTDQADRMLGRGGNDLLLGGLGNDYLDAGDGDDVVQGGLGADTILGGAGRDSIYGSSTGAFVFPDSPNWTLQTPAGGTLLSQGFGWAMYDFGVDADGMPLKGFGSDILRDKVDGDQGNTIDAGAGDDFVAAGTGDDQVKGGDGRDDIYGMAGADVLLGEAGDDRIYGDGNATFLATVPTAAAASQHGSDFIDGGEGNDLLIGQGAGDSIYGGAGNDTIFGDDRDPQNTPISVHGDDYLDGEGGNDLIFGGGGKDTIYGGADDDTLFGDDIAQRLPGTAHGDDYIDGGLGNDIIVGGGGSDTLFGGAGNDQMHGDAQDLEAGYDGDDTLSGGDGSDVLVGGGASDRLYGGQGNDTLLGDGGDMANADLALNRHGNDFLDGGDGDDRLVGGGGSDTLLGGAGADQLMGDANGAGASVAGTDTGASSAYEGADWLDGGEGDDKLWGGGGNDTLLGGAGADRLSGDAGDDGIQGGAGDDTLLGGQGNDWMDGAADNDLLWGGAGSDILVGGDGNDQLDGGEGDDILSGGAGQDVLVSGGGNDVLDGGEGNDGYIVSIGAGHVEIDASSGDDLITFEADVDLATLVGTGTAEELTLFLSSDQSVTVRGSAYFRIGGQTLHSSVLVLVASAGGRAPVPPTPTAPTTVTNLTDANGLVTGSVLRRVEPSGRTSTTVYTGPDATGLKVSTEWSDPDGSSGSERYGEDGSTTGKTVHVDGTYTVSQTWNEGTYAVTYSAQGVALRDEWADTAGPLAGSHGHSEWNSDGTYESVEYAADGSYRTFTQIDGQMLDLRYDAAGNPLNSGRLNFDNGSYATVVQAGDDTITTTYFTAASQKVAESVRLPDGSHSTTTLKANGASSSVLYRRDGTYARTEIDGEGQTVVKEYSVGGRFLGSSITQVNGLTSITSLLDANGKRVNQVWTQADGTTGTTAFSDFDYNGVRNHLAVASAANTEEWLSLRTPDNAYFEIENHNGFFDEWYVPETVGDGESYANFVAVARYDGEMDPWFLGWFNDDDYYIEAGYNSPYYAAGHDVGYYELDDFVRNIRVEGYLSPAGRKTVQFMYRSDITQAYTRGPVIDVGTSTSPVRLRQDSLNGGYVILVEDGFGNVSLTSYDATGGAVHEIWVHNDGSYGSDSYFADGSSTGVSAEPNSTFDSYRISADGVREVNVYPGDQAVSTLASAHAPSMPTQPVVVAPAPVRLGAPPSSGYQYQSVRIERDSAEYQAIFDGQGNVEVNINRNGNLAVAGFVVITDPGYEAEVTVDGTRYEWKYDVTGTPTGRVTYHPDGSFETYTLDGLGQVTGKSRSTTGLDGSVATLRYGSDGQFMGASTVTVPELGQTLTSTFDAGGALTGSTLEVTDGVGNTVRSERDALGNLLHVTTRVMTADNESTITHYDGMGTPISMEITRVTPAGVIQTEMYNGAGQLLGVVVASVEADGSVTTGNYDSAGRLTSVVLSRITSEQDVFITTYDALGNKTREDVLTASGVHEYSADSLDGSRVRTVVQADGSYQVTTRSTAGETMSTQYNAEGAKLSETWARQDGSSGTQTFNADGSSTSTAIYRDGSRSTSLTDTAGTTTTTHRTAAGGLLGTTVTREIQGAFESTSFNAAGVKTSEFTTEPDGSRSESFFAADGSFTGSVVRADGSHDDLSGNAQGVVTVSSYNGAGTLMGTRLNHAPTASAATVTAATRPGEVFSYTLPQGLFSDQDSGDVLTYSASLQGSAYLPEWMWFDATTGTFGGNPGTNDIGTFNIRVTATDRDRAEVGKTITVQVAGMKAGHVADQSATEDQGWSFRVPASTFTAQGNVGAITYAASLAGGGALPGWLQFDPATLTFTGTPRNADTGPLLLTVTATDASGIAVESTFSTLVGNVNDAPVLGTLLEDQSAVAGKPWFFVLPPHTFVDPDRGDALTVAASLADGSALPSWVTFDAASGMFTGIAPQGEALALDIAVTAIDGAGASVGTGFRVDFALPTNHAPVVSQAIGAQTVTEDADWSFTVPASAFVDEDGDQLSWSATLADGSALPSWIMFDPNAGRFTGTPGSAEVGDLAIRITAADPEGLQVSQDFMLEVTKANEAPVVAAPIGSQFTTEDAVWTFTVPGGAFSDPDAGDTLSYSATSAGGEALPAWITFDAATRTFTGTPTNSEVGTLQLVVTATDPAGAATSSTFELQVGNVNDAPVAIGSLPGQQVVEEAPFSFAVAPGVFADVDAGDTLVYTARLADGGALPSWLTFDAASLSFAGTARRANVGDLGVVLIATDTSGASASQSFTLAVTRTPGLSLMGTYGSDTLVGGAGDDLLDGSAAADTMVGGKGDDQYVVDDMNDVVVEDDGEGTDTVFASTTYSLAANVENLVLTGDGGYGGSGNELDNWMQGNAAANTLDGGWGADTMVGLGGDDTYFVDDVNDVVIESPQEGIDRVESTVSYTLGANVEDLALIGLGNLYGAGNELENHLYGTEGDNILDGRAGADVMSGGAGMDIYIVDDVGDVVIELLEGGTKDKVEASVSYTLGANIERLELTGSAAINGTGNNLANWMQGNGAANTLNGAAGADTMLGGGGDDNYVVDNTGDVVIENAGEGVDTVLASVSYTLSANVENLVLTGTASINGTGNASDNRLQGNTAANVLNGGAGDDFLDGGAGADTMVGGAGNDSYAVDDNRDVVTELADEGIDTVFSAISYTLKSDVENLTLTGASAINGTGNAAANSMQGNDAANVLTGGGGNDVLNGMGGNDTLDGGAGDDTYGFNRGSGSDLLVETGTSAGDIAQFGPGIAVDQLWFTRSTNNLVVQVIGTSDYLTLKDWYRNSGAGRLDVFKTSDGHALLESQVQNLVDAMASFAPPPAGQTTLSPQYQTSLAPTIAANWH